MNTSNQVKINVKQTITDIAYKLENSKLSAEALKSTRLKTQKLSKYLGITPKQCYVFVAIFTLQSKDNMIEMSDIIFFLNLSQIEAINLRSDIEAMYDLGLIAKQERFQSNQSIYSNGTTYSVCRNVVNAIFANQPIEFEKPELLDIYTFYDEVSSLIGQRDMLMSKTRELLKKIESLENANPQIDVIEKLKKMNIAIEERTILYEMSNDLAVCRKPTSLLKTFDEIYDHPRQRMSKIQEFSNKENILFHLELITATEARFVNDQQLELTNEAMNILLGDDAVLFSQKKMSKSIISNTDIKEKKLFFEGKLKSEIDFISKTLQQEQFDEMKSRLEEEGLTPGINVLLYGHPGTGKTEICYQLSRQTGRDIVLVDLSQVKNKFYGESEKRVKDIFYNYRKLADKSELTPILLINEADGLLSKRKENNRHSIDQTENTIQNILLEEIEKFKGILLCTSNLAQNLDSAFERRFLFKVKFEAPSVDTKKLIWKSKLPWLADDLIAEVATSFPFTGGQIDNIAKKVAIHKVLNGENPDREKIIDFCSSETLQKRINKVGFN